MEGANMVISRKTGNTETNYFMMVSNNPMKKFKFKVKITGFRSTDRYLDMGLVSENRKNATANLINSFGNGGNYSYCGYSQSNVSGPMLASSSSSGFEVGTEIFYEYDNNKLDIYTQDRRANMTKTLDEGNYYFFFVLYHPEASCIVTRLI